MSGGQPKPRVTVASMKERHRLNKKMQDSPPTPPNTYLDDIPTELPAPGIRRSTRVKVGPNPTLDIDAVTEPQPKKAPKTKKGKKTDLTVTFAEVGPAPIADDLAKTAPLPPNTTVTESETVEKSTRMKQTHAAKAKSTKAMPPSAVATPAAVVATPAAVITTPAAVVPAALKPLVGSALGLTISLPATTSTLAVPEASSSIAVPSVPAVPASPNPHASPASSEKSVANELVVMELSNDDRTPAPTTNVGAVGDENGQTKPKGKKKKNAKGKGKALLDVGADVGADMTVAPNHQSLAVVHVPTGQGDMDEYDEKMAAKKTPSKEDYELWRQQYGKTGDIEKAFEALASSNLDWCRIPQGAWDVRSGPVSKAVRARLEAVAQGASFLISSIATDAGISKAMAWKHTGLLQVESRASNAYNLFCKERAQQLREENDGNPIGDAKETNKTLSHEWKEMDADEREALTDRLRREHFKADANMLKDDLVSSQQREKFIQDQADALSTVATQLNVRTDLIMLGMLVLPSTSVAPAVSTCFTSSSVAIEAWKRHDKELDTVMSFIAKKAEGGVTSDLVVWPAPERQVIEESQGWHRDRCLARALKYLTIVQKMTAPWHELANGEFLWRDSNKHCARNGYVLCGWPVTVLFPGSVKSDGAYSALKNLGKGGARSVITKFIGDRQSLPRRASNVIALKYYEIDALTVTKDGIIVETATATEKELADSHALSAYPLLDRPVLVSASGEVLVSFRQIEADEARRHRVLLDGAVKALKDESDDDAAEDEDDAAKDGDSTAKAMVTKLPALEFAVGRAPIVPMGKAVVKGEKMEQDTDDDDKETAKEESEDDDDNDDTGGKGKGKEKEKRKRSKKRSRKEAVISSDEDEDAEDKMEEHSSKRRKKSGKSDAPSS